MKIGIDTNIFAVDRAGSAVYTRQLIKNLISIDNKNSYDFFSFGSEFIKKKGLNKRLENIIRDALWIPFMLPYKLNSRKIDILHCPTFKAPTKCRIPLVVTFLDIHILKNPTDYSSGFGSYCKFMLPKIAKTASRLITISESSKKDIVETLRIPEDKVVVTHCGYDKIFIPISDKIVLNKVKEKYNLPKRFILYVGAIQPRKNISALLRAYAGLIKEKKLDYQLVFTSGTGWKNKDIFTLIGELEIKDNVKFLGYIPESDLPCVYSLADFFVYPSFYEGFGMPALEAMACGCPVITSNTSSLPEVIGDAGIMIDPYSMKELEDAMLRLAKDSLLRGEMREKGFKRVKMFSWEKCARETLNVYRECF